MWVPMLFAFNNGNDDDREYNARYNARSLEYLTLTEAEFDTHSKASIIPNWDRWDQFSYKHSPSQLDAFPFNSFKYSPRTFVKPH